MDFDFIKDFIDSIGDTIMILENDEAIELYQDIKELIEECSSFKTKEDIPESILKNLIRLFSIFLAFYRLIGKGGSV